MSRAALLWSISLASEPLERVASIVMVGIVLAAVKVVEVDSAVVAKFTRAAVGSSHGRFF
jgi:hypothetical protein